MATIKQYINLVPDRKDPRLGRICRHTTKISVKKARRVHLLLVEGPKNLKKLPGTRRGGIAAPGQKHVGLKTTDDGTVKFDLVMSTHGGDKFSVKVARDRAGKKKVDASDTYEVWRRLYYQLTRMKSSYSFPFAKIKSEYEKHFVELEETSTVSCPHKENLETPQLKGYRSHFKKKKVPFECHIVLIDRQCDSETHTVRHSVGRTKTFFRDDEDDWPFSDWLVNAGSRTSGGSWTSGAIAVTRHTHGGHRGILVDVSGAGVNPAVSPVDVDIEYKILKGEYTGDATYKPHIFIAVGKPRSDESKSKTVAHEIGHGLGMVPITGHNLQYDNANGGMGSHCRYKASPNKKSKARGGTFTGVYSDGECVMFAYSSEHYQFCPTCKDFVRKAHLFASDMRSRGWD